MSDATSAAMFASGVDFLADHRRMYLESGGARGHLIRLMHNEGRGPAPHLLLGVTGRRSGRRYVHPLLYGIVGGEVAIVASKGGADHHPGWYHNLVAQPEVRFQIATQAYRGTWRDADESERDGLWHFLDGNYPLYADYRASTARRIPIVLMTMQEDIPVFTLEDHDA